MRHAFLSSIPAVPVSYFIYSSFSFFGPHTGGEITGPWFVRALTELGRSEEAVRMELFRMERDDELESRKVGRVKHYSPTFAAKAEIEAGSRKIFSDAPGKWNNKWTVVQFQFDAKQRVQRDRLRSLLNVEGFATIGSGVFIHPRSPSRGLISAINSLKTREAITVFTGASLPAKDARTFAKSVWDLRAVSMRYQQFRSHFGALPSRVDTLADSTAFAARFALVFDYLGAAWADPELPPELLPRSWPGDKARTLARSLYEQLAPPALRHAHALGVA